MIANLDRASNDKIAHAYDQAKNLARAGQLQRAESLCHEILREHSVHTGALLLRGVIELQTARPSQAAASFRHSLRHDPSNATAQALLGDVLLELQQPREALEAYDRGLRLNPGLLPAHFGRANALLDLATSSRSACRLSGSAATAAEQSGSLIQIEATPCSHYNSTRPPSTAMIRRFS